MIESENVFFYQNLPLSLLLHAIPLKFIPVPYKKKKKKKTIIKNLIIYWHCPAIFCCVSSKIHVGNGSGLK